jgi:hypothetical protein
VFQDCSYARGIGSDAASIFWLWWLSQPWPTGFPALDLGSKRFGHSVVRASSRLYEYLSTFENVLIARLLEDGVDPGDLIGIISNDFHPSFQGALRLCNLFFIGRSKIVESESYATTFRDKGFTGRKATEPQDSELDGYVLEPFRVQVQEVANERIAYFFFLDEEFKRSNGAIHAIAWVCFG